MCDMLGRGIGRADTLTSSDSELRFCTSESESRFCTDRTVLEVGPASDSDSTLPQYPSGIHCPTQMLAVIAAGASSDHWQAVTGAVLELPGPGRSRRLGEIVLVRLGAIMSHRGTDDGASD